MSEMKDRTILFDYENVTFDFLDKDYIRVPEYTVYRVEIGGNRHYVAVKGDKVAIMPSVTTILKDVTPMPYGLLSWYVNNGFEKTKEILEVKSDYGTKMHGIFTQLLLGAELEMIDYEYEELQDIIGFIQFVKDYKVKPLALEYIIIGNGYAGAIDLVCKMVYKDKEITALIDYKTGRHDFYDSNALQLKAYQEAWDIYHPDLPIDRIFNYGCKNFRLPIGKSVTPYNLKDQTENPINKNWDLYLQIYKNINEKIDTKKTVFNQKQISLETDILTTYQTVDTLEELKEKANEQD